MRYRLVLLALTVFLLSGLSGSSEAGDNLDLGISLKDGKLNGFYLGVRDYYRVPEQEVVVIRERRLPDDEMPVAFFIARKAHVPPSEVIGLRLNGLSWMEITDNYDLDPEIYYIDYTYREGPYGRAWGHYNGEQEELTDEDIVNLVNLKFLCERYKLPPESIIVLRSEGRSFVAVDYELRRRAELRERENEERRREYRDHEDEDRDENHDNGRHNGWGRGRGHDREDD